MGESAMNYTTQYADMVQKYLARKPRPADGLSNTKISQVEEILGFQLPTSLCDYYRVAGNLPELNKAHNLLFDLPDLFVDGDFLIFMEENQAVVHWGIKLNELVNPDPGVWSRVNSNSPEWYSENMTVSEFIISMFDFQAGL